MHWIRVISFSYFEIRSRLCTFTSILLPRAKVRNLKRSYYSAYTQLKRKLASKPETLPSNSGEHYETSSPNEVEHDNRHGTTYM